MKVACTTIYDPRDPQAFGGRGYYMIRAVAAKTNMAYLGPLTMDLDSLSLRTKAYLSRRVAHKIFTPDRDKRVVMDYGRQLAARLAYTPGDLIFSPMSPGSQPVAYLDTKLPVVIWTDATLAAAIKLYPELSPARLSPVSLRDGLANEKAALQKASLLIYTSDWVAQSAIGDYRLNPDKVRVLPFGANFDDEFAGEEIRAFIERRPMTTCKLLFISSYWQRKGGDIALEVTRRLNARGQPAELIVVGNRPPIPDPLPSYLKLAGFLRKTDPVEKARLYQLMAEAHFLILPTRADCTPFVFSEACAFGVPCISTNVGGIASVIREGVNGRTFALDADIDAYVDYIAATFAAADGYRRLAAAAYDDYATRLSWDVSGGKIAAWFEELR